MIKTLIKIDPVIGKIAKKAVSNNYWKFFKEELERQKYRKAIKAFLKRAKRNK